ncbi:TonB family protein [Acinetobacter sp. Tr-809]|uniref:energy transducer TonB n=1 Tax=Acinetobacter sp. Tr-809 TaxID=2608324 RepID=UPI00141FB82D|nr:energy transducer TonB [Acinetobacter sp. Tr-809]NIE95241.1 TonB family protein [Acinetobacter sp. Tr-809]
MKSKLQYSAYRLNTKLPSILVLAHSNLKSIIVLLVIVLHLVGLWFLSHFIEPYTLAASPKVNALNIRFVSLAPAEHVSPQKTAQSAITQSPKQQPLQKESELPASQQSAETIEQKIFISQNATNTVQQKQPSQKDHSIAPQPKQTVAAQSVENIELKKQIQADQQSTAVNENQKIHKEHFGENQSLSAGVKAPAAQQELSRAPESQVDRDEPVQVSSVDVLSFGKLAYDDRELKQQNRMVELRLRINENGQPIEIQLKQSSGVSSLDERVLNAARQSKFKPYKVNGRAVTVVVDFPVQLKLSRSR